MSVEMTGATRELMERRKLREQAAPELAKQKQQARAKKSDTHHEVKRTVAKSRLQEGAAAHNVAHPAPRRWRRAFALPGLPDPLGYVLCYIARHGQHRGDEAGLIAALSEGWEFARLSDFPGHILQKTTISEYGAVIGNASSVLMKLPEDFKAQRDEYFNSRRDIATRHVNNPKPGLAEANSKMPLVEDVNQSEARLARGRRVRKSVEAMPE